VPIRVVLAEDFVVVREVLVQLLHRSPEVDLVAIADEPTLLLETTPSTSTT
jgi:DNA-binding NarL/FixJ family response regulator